MGTATGTIVTAVSGATTTGVWQSLVRDYMAAFHGMLASAGAVRHAASLPYQFDASDYAPTTVATTTSMTSLVDTTGRSAIIYQLDDDPAAPCYVRLTFKIVYYSGKAMVQFTHQFGTAVGAGTADLVGPSATAAGLGGTTPSTSALNVAPTGPRAAFACAQPGFLAFGIPGSEHPSGGFAMDRLRELDGSPSTFKGAVYTSTHNFETSVGASMATSYKYWGFVANNPQRVGNPGGSGWGKGYAVLHNSETTGMDGAGNYYVGPLLIPTPRLLTTQNLIGVYTNDFPEGAVFTAPSPGISAGQFRANRVFFAVEMNAGGSAYAAVRWE